MNPIEKVKSQLRNHGIEPKATGTNQWESRCPAHEDRKPSLSISRGDDGRALLWCHRGCETSEILKALSLTEQDLFSNNGASSISKWDRSPQTKRSFPTWEEAAAVYQEGSPDYDWTYTNEIGKPVGKVLRWDNDGTKTVRPLSNEGDQWFLKQMPALRPLFNLPKLRDAHTIYVCEGEKATDACERLGFTPATTCAGGSKATGKTDWSPLASKNVVIFPDNDQAGEKYAQDVYRLAHEAGASCVHVMPLLELVPGKEHGKGDDLADVLREDESSQRAMHERVQARLASRPASESRRTPDVARPRVIAVSASTAITAARRTEGSALVTSTKPTIAAAASAQRYRNVSLESNGDSATRTNTRRCINPRRR